MRRAMIVGDSIPVRRAAIVLTITNTRGARCGLQRSAGKTSFWTPPFAGAVLAAGAQSGTEVQRHLWYDQV